MSVAPTPWSRSVHVELRKAVDTRAGRWLMITMSALSLVVAVVLVVWGAREELTLQTFLSMMTLPLALLLPIVGIMAATQEWSQRTGLVTFALEPRRGRVVTAKLAAAVLLGLVVIAVSGLVAAVFHAGVTTFSDAPGDWTLHGAATLGLVLALVMYVLQGVGFGLAFLSTPVAIVASLVLPTAWTIASAMIPRLSSVAEWLDLTLVTTPLMTGQMEAGDWARLGTSALVWIGLPIAVGSYRVLTREVR